MNSGPPVERDLDMNRFMAVLALIVLGIVMLVLFSIWNYDRGKTLAQEIYQLPDDTAGDFLSEEVAIEYANRLLTQRFPNATWKPIEDDRSFAPDGTKDQFLLRNTIDSSVEGTIVFNNTTPSDAHPNRVSAWLTLRGRELTCVLSRVE